MSETVYYSGTLTEIELIDNNLERTAKHLLRVEKVERDDHYDTALEQLEDEFYEEYIAINSKIYKVHKETKDPYDSLFISYPTDKPEVIKFEVRYHNGGCSFNEAIKEALENMEE